MITSFNYLRFDLDSGFYREEQTSLFNKKEIELIQKTTTVTDIKSGDVVYRPLSFYSEIGMSQRELKDYYINLLSNSGIVLSNALSPEKSTLFVEDISDVQSFNTLKKDVEGMNDTNYCYFRKIPYESLMKRVNEKSDFSFIVHNFDYGMSTSNHFEELFTTNGYFYILMENGIKDTVFENETILKGFSVPIFNSNLPVIIINLLKSAYTPKIIATHDFCRCVKNLKKSISYEEFIQIQSYIGTDYADNVPILLNKYDLKEIQRNIDSDPESFIYLRILDRNTNHHDYRVKQALTKAYSTGKEHLIQTYLSFMNTTTAFNLVDIILEPGILEFKPVAYYGWSGPSVYSNLDFTKDVENTDEVE